MPVSAQTSPQIRVVQASNAVSTRRVQRRPQHRFNLKSYPFEIVPFMIAPVLPGETMENLLMQSRVVSDPISNPLIGWHKEYYWFYCSHRSLMHQAAPNGDSAELLKAMMLDPATNIATLLEGANDTALYQFKGGVEFVRMCLNAVVAEYFRDEDEASTSNWSTLYPLAQFDQESWIQSLKLEAAGADDSELPGVDEQEELDILPGFTGQYAQWEMMRDHGMTDLTYEDYLKSYGVSVPKEETETPEERFKPELLRFVRDWTYPTNHVDPATGTPSSACSWSIAERADKKRFFKEPGFVFGVTVTRPKLYLGSQKGAAVGMLKTPYTWLPAVLEGHPYISVTEQTFSATDGILQNQAQDYWLDVRDLFVYGDQFVNHAMSVAANHGVALPAAGLGKYPSEAIAKSFFKTAGTDFIKEDGVVHLNILSRIRDYTK